jgi:hypothetical protein
LVLGHINLIFSSLDCKFPKISDRATRLLLQFYFVVVRYLKDKQKYNLLENEQKDVTVHVLIFDYLYVLVDM